MVFRRVFKPSVKLVSFEDILKNLSNNLSCFSCFLDTLLIESSDSEADTSMEKINESKISGVSPFYSAEELNVSLAESNDDNPKDQNTANNVKFQRKRKNNPSMKFYRI